MFMASNAIVWYGNSTDYMMLFQSTVFDSFFLSRLVFNAMEYLYAGYHVFWIVLKSISVVDVLLVTLALIILFQNSDHVSCASMRLFTIFLILLGLIVFLLYAGLVLLASAQLTTDAGFAILRIAAEIGRFSGLALIVMCILMNGAIWVIKK